jgi:hypothetical protein
MKDIITIVKEIKCDEDNFKREREIDLQVDDFQESWIIENHLRQLDGHSNVFMKDAYICLEDCTNYFYDKPLVFYIAERSICTN